MMPLPTADIPVSRELTEVLSLRDAAISAFDSAPGTAADYRAIALFERSFMGFRPTAADLAAIRSGAA